MRALDSGQYGVGRERDFKLTLITTGSTSAATRAAKIASHTRSDLNRAAIAAAHQHINERETISSYTRAPAEIEVHGASSRK
jgi:hypothetical protein